MMVCNIRLKKRAPFDNMSHPSQFKWYVPFKGAPFDGMSHLSQIKCNVPGKKANSELV